jgi:hypothetical protein
VWQRLGKSELQGTSKHKKSLKRPPFQNKYGPSCPRDAAVVTFSATQIANILELHNKARSLIASGKVTGLPPAVQMLELVRIEIM